MPTESELISKTRVPTSRTSLTQQLRQGGLMSGATVIVHASLSSLGWVAGGAVAVIQALLDCLAPDGTLVMPAHSAHLTDPAGWRSPPVPAAWVETIRREMPAYDPAITPTRNMGAVAELFRTWPGTRRSSHPMCSFAALGPLAKQITTDHALNSPLGENSPLAKLYAAEALVLLLGVDFKVCTLLHLAEVRAWPGRPKETQGSPMLENGLRHWTVYNTPPTIDSRHFLRVGEIMGDSGQLSTFDTGNTRSTLFSSRIAVDCAVDIWKAGEPLS